MKTTYYIPHVSAGHYENFPVASLLLPRLLREPVAVIYRFARSADDFADEGDAPPAARLAQLEGFRTELRRIAARVAPETPLFEDVARIVREHALPLAPFKMIVKDYFTVCDSYYAAIRTATPDRIEALDMGRRALHDEGSNILMERLKRKVSMDFDTARRLFTLICVLHWKG